MKQILFILLIATSTGASGQTIPTLHDDSSGVDTRWKWAEIVPVALPFFNHVDSSGSIIDTVTVNRLYVYYVAHGSIVTFHWSLEYAVDGNYVCICPGSQCGEITLPLDEGLSLTYLQIFQYIQDRGTYLSFKLKIEFQ